MVVRVALSPEQLRGEASCATQWSAVVSWASLLAFLSLFSLLRSSSPNSGCEEGLQSRVANGSRFAL